MTELIKTKIRTWFQQDSWVLAIIGAFIWLALIAVVLTFTFGAWLVGLVEVIPWMFF